MRLILCSMAVFFTGAALGCGGQGRPAGCGAGPGGGESGAAAASTAAGGETAASGGGAAAKWVSGYYVSWQQGMSPPEEIPWGSLTHLIIARVVPNADGSLNTNFDISPEEGPIFGKKLAKLARDNGRKAILMVGGAGTHDQFASAASPARRAAFVQALVKIVRDYGFDGLDLDWEPVPEPDHENLKALAADLRAAMPEATLTIPLHWINANFPQVAPIFKEIAPIFDQMNIMSYGMEGPWGGWMSWHSSALMGEKPNTPSSIDVSVKAYLAAGVPAKKLGVGVGFFGECWVAPVTGPNQPIRESRVAVSDNVMTYGHIMRTYYSEAAYSWDPVARASYLSFDAPRGPEGCTYISYDDERSIKEKGDYARRMGLGGAMVWTIGQGHIKGAAQTDPLMQALAKSFLQ